MTATRAGRTRGTAGRAERKVMFSIAENGERTGTQRHTPRKAKGTRPEKRKAQPRKTEGTRPKRSGETKVGEASYLEQNTGVMFIWGALGQNTRCRVRSERRGSTPTIYMAGMRAMSDAHTRDFQPGLSPPTARTGPAPAPARDITRGRTLRHQASLDPRRLGSAIRPRARARARARAVTVPPSKVLSSCEARSGPKHSASKPRPGGDRASSGIGPGFRG